MLSCNETNKVTEAGFYWMSICILSKLKAKLPSLNLQSKSLTLIKASELKEMLSRLHVNANVQMFWAEQGP